MYEQLFAKPKMTEKLLLKPPFRYLHDIFTATMGKTGWGEGMF
jgi:TRAF3-interacting protein 1